MKTVASFGCWKNSSVLTRVGRYKQKGRAFSFSPTRNENQMLFVISTNFEFRMEVPSGHLVDLIFHMVVIPRLAYHITLVICSFWRWRIVSPEMNMKSFGIFEGSDKSTLGKDLLVTLMHHDPNDLGSLILITFRNLFLMGPLGLVFVQLYISRR